MNSNQQVATGFLAVSILFFLGSFYKRFMHNFSDESVHTANIFLICSIVSIFLAMALTASGKSLKTKDILNIIIICLALLAIVLVTFNYLKMSVFLILACAIFGTVQFLITESD